LGGEEEKRGDPTEPGDEYKIMQNKHSGMSSGHTRKGEKWGGIDNKAGVRRFGGGFFGKRGEKGDQR